MLGKSVLSPIQNDDGGDNDRHQNERHQHHDSDSHLGVLGQWLPGLRSGIVVGLVRKDVMVA